MSQPNFLPNVNNFDKFYSFYSTADEIQFIGSLAMSSYTRDDWAGLTEDFQANMGYLIKRWASPDFRFWLSQMTVHGARKLRIPNRRVLNFRVQIDGKSPSHIDYGTLIMHLDPVIKLVDWNYKWNDDFDLNIDKRSRNIHISVRHFLSLCDISAKTAISIDEKVIKQLEKEKDLSQKAAVLFEEKYKKDIHSKGWRIINYIGEQATFVKNLCGW